jgi:hypothetical protein
MQWWRADWVERYSSLSGWCGLNGDNFMDWARRRQEARDGAAAQRRPWVVMMLAVFMNPIDCRNYGGDLN